jgi:hypothetical protein
MDFWILMENSQMLPHSLEKELNHLLHDRNDVNLNLIKLDAGLKGIDPTVLVATVAATGTAFGALIGGLFKILGQNSAKRILLRGKQGWQIEVPANISSKKFEEVIKILKDLDQERVNLIIQ